MSYYLPFLATALALTSALSAQANWTVFLYMEAEDLADVAFKQIYDMVSAIPEHKNDTVQVLLQIHTRGSVAWRYKIEKNMARSLMEIPLHTSGSQDIEEAITWALSTYPAQHAMVIFSGHGFGVLEPSWCEEKQEWQRTYETPALVNQSKSEELLQIVDTHQNHKCLLPRRYPKGYITIDSLATALQKVTTKGHRIDILGMDACMMSTLEVAYTLAPYASYFIASQECEQKEGWHYKAVVEQLYNIVPQEPYAIARELVYAYGAYYRRQKALRFTLAAVELACIRKIKENLDAIASLLRVCQKQYGEALTSLVTKARSAGPAFCQSPYSDLYSFYEELASSLEILYESEDLLKLKEALLQGIELLESAIIAVTNSPALKKGHGLSIYFPLSSFDQTYLKTGYAQESQWSNFLKELVFSPSANKRIDTSLVFLERCS
jgi:hypothetical protein